MRYVIIQGRAAGLLVKVFYSHRNIITSPVNKMNLLCFFATIMMHLHTSLYCRQPSWRKRYRNWSHPPCQKVCLLSIVYLFGNTNMSPFVFVSLLSLLPIFTFPYSTIPLASLHLSQSITVHELVYIYILVKCHLSTVAMFSCWEGPTLGSAIICAGSDKLQVKNDKQDESARTNASDVMSSDLEELRQELSELKAENEALRTKVCSKVWHTAIGMCSE